MKQISIAMLLIALLMPIMAEMNIVLTPAKRVFAADETIIIKVDIQNHEEDVTWDTYLFFKDSRNTPFYITVGGTRVAPTVLGMLPPELRLKSSYWHHEEKIQLFVCLCVPNTEKVITTARTTFEINGCELKKHPLPIAAELLLDQKVSEQTSRWYSDYKQFDSSWKNTTMGQNNGTTIGKSGCAISSIGNIRGITPSSINSELQSDGGYSGNSVMWSKARGLSYKGNGSISDSLFSSYHVIGDVGGHFVLLTGVESSGRYTSHDPGKSSNPVYSSSQVYSVRLYYK